MAFAEHLAGYFVDFGESVTVAGTAVTAIFDGGYAQTLEAAGTAPSLLAVGTDVAGVAVGDAVLRAGTGYVVRNVIPEPPDEVLTRLVLERQ